MSDNLRELAGLLLRTPTRQPIEFVQGLVDSFTDTHVTVYLSGSTFPVGGIRFLDSYAPRVGDVVWIAKNGHDHIILGTLQDNDNSNVQPWNTAWGLIGPKQESTSQSAGYTVTGNSDFLLDNFMCRNDRCYRVHLNTIVIVSATALWGVDLTQDGASVGRFFVIDRQYALGFYFSSSVLWEPGIDGPVDLRVKHTELTGTATVTYQGDPGLPRQFWVEDIGPRTIYRTFP